MNTRLLLPSASALLLASCATTPPSPSPIKIASEPSTRFAFRDLVAKPRKNGLAVSGRVERKKRTFRMIPGHLHIEAISNGITVGWTDTRWGPLSPRRAFASSRFNATLPFGASQVDEVRVSYMPSAHAEGRKSGKPS